jgi:glucosamine-6-phosphate deaminase
MPRVRSFPDRAAMGAAAAADVAEELRVRLAGQDAVRMIFAAAPSQSDMLDRLVATPDIDWSRVTAFHMDEYLGLPPDAPARFANWLDRAIFTRLPFAEVHRIDPEAGAATYAKSLAEAPIDVVCLGIGQNGHLAFNDPPVADLDDPEDVKIVELDRTCRQQQVDDGAFPTFEDVPTHAITLTLPRLLDARKLFCVVPGAAKRHAVERALNAPISAADPATALRTHRDVTLYLDAESFPAGSPPERSGGR